MVNFRFYRFCPGFFSFADTWPHLRFCFYGNWGRFCGLAHFCRLASAQGCPFTLFSLLRCVGRLCGRASVTPRPLMQTVQFCEAWLASVSSHLRSKIRRCDYTGRPKFQIFLKSKFWSVNHLESTRGSWDLNQIHQQVLKHHKNLVETSNKINNAKTMNHTLIQA